MIRCHGCGGVNQPDSVECEWCARPFRAETTGSRRWWPLAAVLLLVLFAAAALGVAILTLSDPGAVVGRSPAVTPARPLTATPPRGLIAGRTPLPRGSQAIIVNTDGQGASLRAEPSSQAQRLTILAEDAVVRIVGAAEVVEGESAWVEVQDATGRRGWVQSNLVHPIVNPSPTPR